MSMAAEPNPLVGSSLVHVKLLALDSLPDFCAVCWIDHMVNKADGNWDVDFGKTPPWK